MVSPPRAPSTNTIVVALTATSQPNKHTRTTVQVLRAASRVLRVASVRMHVAWCGDARCILSDARTGWRRVVACAAMNGIPVPAISTALAFYDGYRCERLPANLLQAQRDYFGAHT